MGTIIINATISSTTASKTICHQNLTLKDWMTFKAKPQDALEFTQATLDTFWNME